VNARLSFIVATALLLSCGPMPGGPSDARSAIESLLQKRTAAVAANDADAFRSTVDGARPALRRTQQDLFDAMRARPSGASSMAKVLKVEAYGAYTRAYVEDSPELTLLGVTGPASYKRVYFRQEGGAWLLTEPKAAELGELKHDRIADVDVEHWAIDDDVVGAVAAEVTAQRAAVARSLPSGATLPPVSLRLYPTAETIGLAGISDAAAAHAIAVERDPLLRVYDLWWTAGPGELAAFSRFVLQDQLLGMARERLAPLAYLRMDWWLRHGLGQAAGGPDVGGAIRDVCAAPLTWQQMFDGPQKDTMGGGEMMGDSLAPTYERFMSPTTPRAFLQARSMIEYLRAAKGERAYWDLVLAYQKESGPSIAYASALGITPERFYSAWLAWAKARC
jgi:hypothetical protein